MEDNFRSKIRETLKSERLDIDKVELRESIFSKLSEKKKKRRIFPLFFLFGITALGGLWLYSSLATLSTDQEVLSNYSEETRFQSEKPDMEGEKPISISSQKYPINKENSDTEVSHEDKMEMSNASLHPVDIPDESRNSEFMKDGHQNKSIGYVDYGSMDKRMSGNHENPVLLSPHIPRSSDFHSPPDHTMALKDLVSDERRLLKNSPVDLGATPEVLGLTDIRIDVADLESIDLPMDGELRKREISQISDDQNKEGTSSDLEYLRKLPISSLEIEKDKAIVTAPSLTRRIEGNAQQREIEIALVGHFFEGAVDRESTQGLFSTDAQFFVKYRLGKLSPFMGLRNSRMNSVLDHSWTAVTPFESLGQAAAFCPDNPEECLVFNLLESRTQHVFYNVISSWEVPVGVEYETGNQFSFWARGFISIPINSKLKYEYLDENANIINVEDLEDSSFTHPWSFQLSSGLSANISSKSKVYVGLGFHSPFKSIEIKPIGQKIRSRRLSLSLGLSYAFH